MARAPVKLRRFKAGHALSRSAGAFVGGFENRANWHINSNGEAELLSRLSQFCPSTVFDVGANTGEWSALAASLLPDATIHAFEPVPDTFERLRAVPVEFGPRVAIHQLALGDQPKQQFVSIDTRSALVSLLDDADPNLSTSISVEVVRGDDFCSQTAIDHIDLLKVDAEGFDHLVLSGFNQMLANCAVDVIQFEYGVWALRTKFLLNDFYTMLQGMGYVVGKLFPEGVAFTEYSKRMEDFSGLNYVAVSTERADLIEALRER